MDNNFNSSIKLDLHSKINLLGLSKSDISKHLYNLGVEKKINPFLKADNRGFIKSVGISGSSASESFGEIRLKKDNY